MFNKLKTKLKLKLIHWLEIDKLNSNLISVSKDLKTYKINTNQEIKQNYESLESVLNKEVKSRKEDCTYLNNKIIKKYNDLDNKYDSLHRTIQSCVKMGADIQQSSGYKGGTGSWAVVCFKRGNQDIVKFIDLDTCGRSGIDMFNYLRQFDASRHVIDAPWGCGLHKELFYTWDKEE